MVKMGLGNATQMDNGRNVTSDQVSQAIVNQIQLIIVTSLIAQHFQLTPGHTYSLTLSTF